MVSNLKRIKHGMTFEESVQVIANDVPNLDEVIFQLCEDAAKLCQVSEPLYGLLTRLDSMDLYGYDLELLHGIFCKKRSKKFLTIIWACELGEEFLGLENDIPDFAKRDTLRRLIDDLRSGKDPESYPFNRAWHFVKANSRIHD